MTGAALLVGLLAARQPPAVDHDFLGDEARAGTPRPRPPAAARPRPAGPPMVRMRVRVGGVFVGEFDVPRGSVLVGYDAATGRLHYTPPR